MILRKAYSGSEFSGVMPVDLFHAPVIIFTILVLLLPARLLSQNLPEYDELLISLQIPSVGAGDIDALIRGEELYLPVTDLFDFLKIRNVPSPDLETITGFFILPDAQYSISRPANEIGYSGKTYKLGPGDLIRTESNLYLKSSFYGTVFGLECIFNFRSLSVTVQSKLELPLIREMRQEEMRRNIARLKNEVQADTTIGRTYPLFRFGMADWSVTASQEINGRTDTRLNMALGSMIAGGEATASLYYNSSDPFTEKQQYYLWRHVNNDFAPLRQVMAGKIHTGSISSIYNPVVGFQLTNSPTTYRRSFGSYNLSDQTDPGWIVELYVNNVLVDYVKADASGFFTLEVPLVYGNSIIKLKYYGPWGEERIREENITIPYNFLPEKTLEYTISGGIVEDTLKSRFSRASVSYGITRNLTFGGGAEYLSSVTSGTVMPYLNASFRIGGNLLLSGEYAYGVRTKSTLTYRLPSNIQFDLNYTWYDKDQKAIFYNYREERRAALSLPLKIGKLRTFQRFTVYQIVLPVSSYTTGEWLLSGSLFGINTNLTTYGMMIGKASPYLYSNFSMAFRLPAGFVLMPQVQYGYTENKLFSAKVRLEKQFLEHAFLNASYEQNFKNDLRLAEVGLRYDFSFAQAGASVRQTNNNTSLIQYARGSLINDRESKYIGADNRSNVGRGGISIVPYLDLNNNGKRDTGEPKAYGLNLHSSGGRIEKSDSDTTIRILGLEPYTNCFVDLDPNSFDNLAWRLPKQTFNIAVDPNILKLVEVPVNIAGEATGYITLIRDGGESGIGRVIVNFLTGDLKPAGKTLSEGDGYYSYFGLPPGNYTVSVDTAQLNKLGLISDPGFREFIIKSGIDGDIAGGLDFMLERSPWDTIRAKPAIVPRIPEAAKKDTTYLILHEVTEELYTITRDSWAIQIGAFRDRSLAEGFRKNLQQELGKEVQITIAGDFYRVRILDLPTRDEVDESVIKLNKLGFNELWVIHLIAKQQERLLITREDSLARIRESGLPLTEAELASIRLAAFRLSSDAVIIRNGLLKPLSEKVTLEPGGKYYNLLTPDEPLIEQTVLDEMEKSMPPLRPVEVEQLSLLSVIKRPAEKPATRSTETAPERLIVPFEFPDLAGRETLSRPIANKFETLAVRPEPRIALQVGVFHKKAQALRAQRKIIARLNLPVEIVLQFDYYHVIVTGFFTREETTRYYPELAGIGYPNITLIENYVRQE